MKECNEVCHKKSEVVIFCILFVHSEYKKLIGSLALKTSKTSLSVIKKQHCCQRTGVRSYSSNPRVHVCDFPNHLFNMLIVGKFHIYDFLDSITIEPFQG